MSEDDTFLVKDGNLDRHIQTTYRGADSNPFDSIDTLPLTPAQKECALEWLAWKLSRIFEGITGEQHRFNNKSYDPLVIKDDTAHSYAFDLWDGGRHHQFESFAQLEARMIEEIINRLKEQNQKIIA